MNIKRKQTALKIIGNRTKSICVGIMLVTLVLNGQAQSDSSVSRTYHRSYSFGYAPSQDLNTSSRNITSVFKISQDAFTLGLRPKLSPKLGSFTSGVWSFATTYLSMIWSHEMGHVLRAKQVGGHFDIHNAAVPIPYTTMHLPQDVSYEEQALSITGGFEVNYTNALRLQSDFYRYNGSYNDELSFILANRLMYPIYISLIIPQDPADPQTWIRTGGDPVHYIKPVWQRYSGDQVFMEDSTVNPGLVKFYKQSALFSTLWNVLDPALFKELKAFFGDVQEGQDAFYLIGDSLNGWTYGTMFNVTPLGYELRWNHYIKQNGRLWKLNFHYGRPFKNYGVEIATPSLVQTDKLNAGIQVETWNQDMYGVGGAAVVQLDYHLKGNFHVELETGYKSQGYMLGRTMKSGFVGWFGLKYVPNRGR